MIHIEKQQEPHELTEYKKQKNAYYDGCPKDAIRKALLEEQGYLCAYCMRRIHESNMKIEHWEAQSTTSEANKLNYRNMLGVCMGDWDGKGGVSCDAHRGNTPLTVNPLRLSSIQKLSYHEHTGEIYSADLEINKDLDKTLNLNVQRLKENRKSALIACKNTLIRKKKQGTWNRALIQEQIDKYSRTNKYGKKEIYAGIVLWYLQKRIGKVN